MTIGKGPDPKDADPGGGGVRRADETFVARRGLPRFPSAPTRIVLTSLHPGLRPKPADGNVQLAVLKSYSVAGEPAVDRHARVRVLERDGVHAARWAILRHGMGPETVPGEPEYRKAIQLRLRSTPPSSMRNSSLLTHMYPEARTPFESDVAPSVDHGRLSRSHIPHGQALLALRPNSGLSPARRRYLVLTVSGSPASVSKSSHISRASSDRPSRSSFSLNADAFRFSTG